MLGLLLQPPLKLLKLYLYLWLLQPNGLSSMPLLSLLPNTCMDSLYAFEVAHDLGMLWKQEGFLLSNGYKI